MNMFTLRTKKEDLFDNQRLIIADVIKKDLPAPLTH